MYKGDERLIDDGEYLPYTMLNFWQWALSNIQFNMTRGSFAEFIVRCALDRGGIITNQTIGLKSLRTFCEPCRFSELYQRISDVCSEICSHPDNRPVVFIPCPQN